jgi:probable rRNA maturation factor
VIHIEVSGESVGELPLAPARQAIQEILREHGIRSGEVSLAVVDDVTIHSLNLRHLNHDYPTDVLSFVLERGAQSLEGEVIVSADTARREAARCGWPVQSELLWYVIHGTLHLVGMDDATAAERQRMRARERDYLCRLGIDEPPPEQEGSAPSAVT